MNLTDEIRHAIDTLQSVAPDHPALAEVLEAIDKLAPPKNLYLYLMQRADPIERDEYAGFTVCAESERAAAKLVDVHIGERGCGCGFGWYWRNVVITLLGPANKTITKQEILLSSFL